MPLYMLDWEVGNSWKPAIPTRTLYVKAVHNYPPSTEIVYSTFKKYGIIRKISLHPSQVFFFITFQDPISAVRVLAQAKYFRKRCLYTIREADSWHQPLELADGTVVWSKKEMHAEPTEQLRDDQAPSLMDLNNDCLLHVFQNLTLREIYLLERVNSRLRSLSFEIWSRVTHLDFKTVFPWTREMSLSSLRQILIRCGPSLLSLDISALRGFPVIDRALLLIDKYCPKLIHLNISSQGIKSHVISGLRNLAGQLKSIKINFCSFFNHEGGISFLGSCNSLTEFYANGLVDDDVTFPDSSRFFKSDAVKNLKVIEMDSLECCLSWLLKQLPLLEELLCRHIYPFPIEITANVLRKLTITEQGDPAKVIVQNIWPQLSELEYFSLTCDLETHTGDPWENFRVELPKSGKLKELLMLHWPITSDSLGHIAKQLLGQLVNVSMHGCDYICSRGLSSFLANQPNLKQLNLTDPEHNLFIQPIIEDYVLTRGDKNVLTVFVNQRVESEDPLLNIVYCRETLDCSQCSDVGFHACFGFDDPEDFFSWDFIDPFHDLDGHSSQDETIYSDNYSEIGSDFDF